MPRYSTVPESFGNLPDWLRRIAQAVNGIMLGRTNNTSTLTLTPNAVSTTLTNSRITADTIAFLEPTTANAAMAYSAGIYQVASAGQIVFNHSNTAAVDKTFRLILVGCLVLFLSFCPRSAFADSILVWTGAPTGDFLALPNCTAAGFALQYNETTNVWACTNVAGAGGGDNVTVNGAAATDVNLKDGDIDFTAAGASPTDVTATVGCTDCVTLKTETAGNFVESVATTAPLSGGAAAGEGSILTLSLTQNAGTDVTADLEEEGVTCVGCISSAKITDDTITPDQLADTQTLDATLNFSVGAFGVVFTVANPASPGIDINGTGAFSDDLLHVHQHTGNPTGGNLIHAEAEDPDVTPLVHITALAPSATGVADAIVGLQIDTDDDDDASFLPLRIADNGGTETLFKVTSTGSVAIGDGSGSPTLEFQTSATDPVITATGGLLTLNTGHLDIDNGFSLRLGEPAAGGQYVAFQSGALTANRSCTLQDAAAPIPDSCVGDGTDAGSAIDAWPIGSVFISVVATNPNTLLGGGTWAAIGAGRVLVGLDSGDTNFDTVEETGGSKTVASSAQTFAGTASTVIVNHTHPVNVGSANDISSTTGAGNYFAGTTGTVTATTGNPTGGSASYTPQGTNTPGAATSVVQPYLVVYMWKRTA